MLTHPRPCQDDSSRIAQRKQMDTKVPAETGPTGSGALLGHALSSRLSDPLPGENHVLALMSYPNNNSHAQGDG